MNNSNWFVSWFNSPYYHLLYNNRDTLEAENFIKKLIGFLNLPLSNQLLDLACGAGRHSKVLHELGYDVTGIDLAPESIAKASLNAEKGLQFKVGDMRNPFGMQAYNAIFSLFTSLGYFETAAEDFQVLQNVHTALKENGVFVLDFFNSTKIIADLKPHYLIDKEGVTFDIHKKVENKIIVKYINVLDNNNSFQFQERVHAYSASDWENKLLKVGLQPIHQFGSYELEPYKAHESARCIWVCMKA